MFVYLSTKLLIDQGIKSVIKPIEGAHLHLGKTGLGDHSATQLLYSQPCSPFSTKK